MRVEKTVTLSLNTEEIWCLQSLISIGYGEINNCIRHESDRLGYSPSDMKKLGEFARRMEDV